MRKKSAFVWSLVAALMMTACSEKDENIQSGETAEFRFEVKFEGTVASPESRAAGSSVIPATSWASVRQIQFFLYEGTTVKYSKIETIPSTSTGTLPFVYTDIPTSNNYTLVAVANADASSDNIASYISGTASTWNAFNVRNKAIADLYLKYKPSAFPAYANPAGNTAYTAPSEVFLAYATGIQIVSGGSYSLTTPLALKREVSLMRVRLNVEDTDAGVNNTSTGAGGVDWTQNVSTLIYTLPDQMNLQQGTTGGVVNTSTSTNIIVSDGVFNNEQTGYTNGNFKRWKDIVVFPNNGGRTSDLGSVAGNDVDAPTAQKYFIVVSALGKAGHVLADGRPLTADQTIYWSGLVSKAFYPNTIREVNLTLKSGGDTTIPVTPVEQGSLTIEVDAPLAWDTNIQDVGIIL